MIQRFCFIALAAALFAACTSEPKQPEKKTKTVPPFSVSRLYYGKIGEDSIDLFTLKNSNGMSVEIISYGATLVSIRTPDRNGNSGETILGFTNLKEYLQKGNPYFGCTVGRYANRIANARFSLDGKTYQLAANDNGNSLHGGIKGFDKVVWNAMPLWGDTMAGLRLTYSSPDGEEGYPGQLDATVTFTLNGDNVLDIYYEATANKPTPVNLTNHAYFNLSGGKSADILQHELTLYAEKFTPVDKKLIPTGIIAPVAGTPMDFTQAKPIGRDLAAVPGGYDHNYVIQVKDTVPQHAATLYDPQSGRVMEMYTTEPGVQFYSGNFLDGSLTVWGNKQAVKHYGLCLEAQHFPDAPNQQSFPGTILKPGETYRQHTAYHFSVRR